MKVELLEVFGNDLMVVNSARVSYGKNKETFDLSDEKLIDLGVSKEQARTILPLNLNTQFIWTGSLLSFIHLFKLRLKSDAQQETRELVQLMLDQLKENGSFKHSLKAFEL